jgi:CRISPR-associated protein Cmr2
MARCRDRRDAFERYAAVLRKAFGQAADDVLAGAPEPFHAFGHADGQIFFSRRLDELAEESAAPEARTTGLKSAQKALLDFFRDTGTSEPRPYYAMLLADGDRMGRAINAATNFAEHRTLSLCLASFATSAAKIVKEHDGSLLYAGGDDVLALLPLHTALACASALRIDFAGKLSAFPIPGGGSPTLSVGLGISHYIEPMDAALDLARRSERLAKGETRNALAVILEKRGGSPIEVRGAWEEVGGAAVALPARLEAMIEMHRHDEVPDKAAADLAALGAQLRGSAPQLVAAETMRILARKQPRHGRAAQIAKHHLADLKKWGPENPVRLANELVLARQLADARDLAEGPVMQAKATE